MEEFEMSGNKKGTKGKGKVIRGRTRPKGTHRPSLKSRSKKTPNDGDSSMVDANETSLQKFKERRAAAMGVPGGRWITIGGFDSSQTTTKQMKDFLLSKAVTDINIVEIVKQGTKILVQTETSEQAVSLQRLNGIKFYGSKLRINFEIKPETLNPQYTSPEFIAQLELGLQSKYHKEGKILDLSNASGGPYSIDFNNSKFTRILFNRIAKVCPEVTTITFGNNKIQSLKGLSFLKKYLPNVVNLSLEGNEISSFASLANLKGLKLREIVLMNNPIANAPKEKYHSEVLKRFPNLEYLDGQKVDAIQAALVPLPPLRPNLYDSEENKQLIEGFVAKYLETYDSNRNALLDIYLDTSFFSLTTEKGLKNLDQLYRSSRNLLLLKDSKKRLEFLFNGRVDIIHFLNRLPPTRHKLDDIRIDGFLMKELGPVLFVSIHGSFIETSTETQRSYDRTFLLTTPPQNLQGIPAVILNDQLHIRNFTNPQPPVDVIIQQQPQPTPQQQPPPETQKELVTKLSMETKLKPEFAQLCLAENGWDYPKSIQAFMILKERNQIQPHMIQS